MSNIIFPSFPGEDIAIRRTPSFNGRVQETPSGREVAIGYESYPRYSWELKFNALRNYVTSQEARQLHALFLLMQGRSDYFLFRDPEFNSATDVLLGVGTGTASDFRIGIRHVEPDSGQSFFEPVNNPYGYSVTVDDVLKTEGVHYTMSTAGVISFLAGNLPTAGQNVKWSGSFRYRARFLENNLPEARVVADIWSASVKFRSVKV